MPKGKAQTKETTVESSHSSGHSSMRRLSSLASLHQLNPFSRSRRGNTTEESLISEISNASSSSIFSSPSDTRSRVLEETSSNIRPAPPHAYGGFLRKNNYVSLPDENTRRVPRSKTFSNLPLPIKTRKHRNRIPSDTLAEEPSVLPESRLPTPTHSTRRYTPFGNSPARFGFGGRLPRSDTEPLLINEGKQKFGVEEALTLKENVPVQSKQSTAQVDFRSSLMTDDSFTSSIDKQEERSSNLPRHPSFSGAFPKSSPILKSKPARRIQETSTIKSRVPLSQRWNSQPNLFSQTPFATSRSYRRATPPLAVLPPFADELTRSLIGESPYVRPQLEKLDEYEERGRRLLRDTAPRPQDSRLVTEAQPPAYWAGRLSTLLDRAKNEETVRFFTDLHDDLSLKHDSDKVYDEAMNTTRIRTAFESLYNSCTTPEAKDSFVVFQLQYAAINNDPELAKPVEWTRPTPLPRHSELSKVPSVASTPSSSSRSVSFVNKLLGRGKRNSIAS